MELKKIPLGKFCCCHTEGAATVRDMMRSVIDGIMGQWEEPQELFDLIESNAQDENKPASPYNPQSIPAGNLILWSEDYILPIDRDIHAIQGGADWETTGWIFVPSEGYISERERIDKKINAVKHRVIPPVTGFMSMESAKDRLRKARKKAGLTQKQLADASGVNPRQIQRVEYGESEAGNLTAKNLLSISDALGVDPHDLI